MIDELSLALLVGFFVVGFIYADRLEHSGAGRDWALAWVLLYGSSLTSEGPYAHLAVPHALGHTMGTLCFTFLLRGALRFTERAVPNWLLPTAILVALGRAGLSLFGAESALWLVGLAVEVPMIARTMVVIWLRAGDSGVERTLAISSGSIGLASIAHSITSLLGGAPDLVVVGYLASSALIGMLQIAALLERVRDREQTLLADHAAQTRELDALVEATPAGIMMVGKKQEIRRINRRLAELAGVEDRAEVVGLRARTVFLPVLARMDAASQQRFRDRWAEIDSSDDPNLADFEIRSNESEERILVVSGSQVRADDGEWLGRVWATRDVTEERLLSERLYRAQRMETLGTLTGGIAHDFNNQLTAILGNARFVERELPKDDELREPLSDVVRSAERCAELTQGLLAFSRQTQPVMRAVDAKAVLREVESVIRPSLPPDVQLELSVAPDLPALEADPSQLLRVLTNLAANARDAVGESGFIGLEARLATETVSGATALEIVVSDSGPGMDAYVRERIFDPFFTTKPLGQGTGLGLAIVYGIVESHGAKLAVESEPGQGSRFHLIWPAAAIGTDSQPTTETQEADAGESATGECILLAEDEEAVRRLMRRSLELRGYRVIETKDGQGALSAFRECGDEIALVLADLSMPRLNGADTIIAIREIRPGLPAVLMTGHLDHGKAASALDDVPVVMKPFDIEELEEVLRAALAEVRE